MELFLNELNKSSSMYEFVKLGDLEIQKKYIVNKFEFITTKYGEKLTVVLDNKLKVILPNSYTYKFSKEVIEKYNKDHKKCLLIYKGLKPIINGKSFHMIQFEESLE